MDAGGAAGEPNAPDQGGSAGLAGEAGNPDNGGEGGAAAALNDAQILKVLSSVNSGEVSAAQVAKPSLQSSAIAYYAQMMIDEHSTANERTLALVPRSTWHPRRVK